MIEPSQIVEHMEVVGSDGQHVGTVDKLVVKLTKKDPAAQGQHHIIDLALIDTIDGGKLKLSIPASQATAEEKPISLLAIIGCSDHWPGGSGTPCAQLHPTHAGGAPRGAGRL